MSNAKTPKPWPTLPTDEATVKFVDEADLSEFDWSKAVPVTMEFRKKNGQLNVRMPEVAETLSKAKNTSVQRLIKAGILTSQAGQVRLLKPDELPADWNPETDPRLTVWEMVHHLIRVLETGGRARRGRTGRKTRCQGSIGV